jgi:hypothetical protein
MYLVVKKDLTIQIQHRKEPYENSDDVAMVRPITAAQANVLNYALSASGMDENEEAVAQLLLEVRCDAYSSGKTDRDKEGYADDALPPDGKLSF